MLYTTAACKTGTHTPPTAGSEETDVSLRKCCPAPRSSQNKKSSGGFKSCWKTFPVNKWKLTIGTWTKLLDHSDEDSEVFVHKHWDDSPMTSTGQLASWALY